MILGRPVIDRTVHELWWCPLITLAVLLTITLLLRYDLKLWIGHLFGARRTFLVEPNELDPALATPGRKERRC